MSRMHDMSKQDRAVREALIRIEAACSNKEENDSFEKVLETYDHRNTASLRNLLPWQREVLSSLSTLYLAGYFDATNYIESLK